jgi:hypothetical protein
MWYRRRVWTHYAKNIIAVDIESATLLASHIRRNFLNKEYTKVLEVIDLQRYKIISNAGKVQVALREKRNKPFIFVACKN